MLDWRVIRVLKQVEPTLLLTMPDTAGHHHQQEQHSVKDTGQLTQTVRQLLPQPSYTIAQVNTHNAVQQSNQHLLILLLLCEHGA